MRCFFNINIAKTRGIIRGLERSTDCRIKGTRSGSLPLESKQQYLGLLLRMQRISLYVGIFALLYFCTLYIDR